MHATAACASHKVDILLPVKTYGQLVNEINLFSTDGLKQRAYMYWLQWESLHLVSLFMEKFQFAID